MTSKFILALAVAAVALPGAAQASSMAGSASRTVSYSDLNLASPGGEHTLDQRIAITARQMCRKVNRELSSQVACQANTLANAEPRADAVVYAARFGGKTAEG